MDAPLRLTDGETLGAGDAGRDGVVAPGANLTLAGVDAGSTGSLASLECSVGRVVDLSATGARLEMRRVWGPAAGQRLHVRFGDGHGSAMVEAEVVWTTPIARFRREVGLRFVDPSAAAVDAVRGMMARCGIVGRGELRGVGDELRKSA